MPQLKRRYSLIDAIRAAAAISMIFYHLCYDIFCVFGVWEDFYRSLPVIIWERSICVTFILVSGLSLNFSRHSYRRGILVSLCGIAVTAATVLFMPEQSIWFGVLSFLGCAMLLTFALRHVLDRMQPLAGTAVFFLLFALFYGVPRGYLGLFSYPLVTLPDALYRYKWLAGLGFPSKGFYSADYFPFLQWIFLYLTGYHLWRLIVKRGWDKYFYQKLPVLDFIGRHSLVLYMLHQPLLYGICRLIFQLV